MFISDDECLTKCRKIDLWLVTSHLSAKSQFINTRTVLCSVRKSKTATLYREIL